MNSQSECFRIIIAAITLVGGIFIHRYSHLSSSAGLTLGLGVALIVVCAAWAGRVVYCRHSFRYANYPRVRFHYEILEKTIKYTIDDAGILTFSRQVKLLALVDNLESYIDKYVWTGGNAGLPTPGSGCADTKKILRAGIWTFYSTYFPYSLRRGQVHEFEVEWPPLTDWQRSSPFVSASTEEPTHKLRFEVQIPESHIGSTIALAEELRGIEAAYPFSTRELQIGGKVEWEIHPKLYRHYRLRWSWSHGEDLHLMPARSGRNPMPARSIIQALQAGGDLNNDKFLKSSCTEVAAFDAGSARAGHRPSDTMEYQDLCSWVGCAPDRI